MKPETLWYWSTRLHRRGLTRLAAMLKLGNYLLFRAILPYECDIHQDIQLLHHGLGVVVHPNARIGRGVCIGHGSLISGTDVGDGTFIAAGVRIAAAHNHRITIGEHCQIGLGAVVTRDVPAYAAVRAPQPEYRPRRDIVRHSDSSAGDAESNLAHRG
jgi:serine O-acetyltransferase